MRIGIFAFWGVNWDGSTLRTLGCHARYLHRYLELVDGVRLFTSCSPELRERNTDAISDRRLEVVPLPWGNHLSVWLNQRKFQRVVGDHLDGLDAMYVRLFDPCPWRVASLCEARSMGLVFHVVGNPYPEIMRRRDWSWAGRWARRFMFAAEDALTFRAARRHTLLINGGGLTRVFGPRHPRPETVISSTLEDVDFHWRLDTHSNDEVVVLYVGFLRSGKRVETLIDACAMLLRAGRRVRLRVVGSAEPASYAESLQARARIAGLDSAAEFAGYVPFGAALRQEYRNADVYVLPSEAEGSARTLLEAASQSLPCVTTDVGSARDLFADGESALIVPRNDAAAIARAIARFMDEPDLRRRCIRNAYEIAGRHTCRAFIQHLVTRLAEAHRRAQPNSNSRT